MENNRRNLLKLSLATVAGAMLANTPKVLANPANLPIGLIYTRENSGKWAKKVKGHAPIITIEGNKVTIKTDHKMTEKHYIVRHTLVTESGEVIGEKTFASSDEEAVSSFELPADKKSFYATSFCNKHDLWVEPFNV
jgi:superoxide reductase